MYVCIYIYILFKRSKRLLHYKRATKSLFFLINLGFIRGTNYFYKENSKIKKIKNKTLIEYQISLQNTFTLLFHRNSSGSIDGYSSLTNARSSGVISLTSIYLGDSIPLRQGDDLYLYIYINLNFSHRMNRWNSDFIYVFRLNWWICLQLLDCRGDFINLIHVFCYRIWIFISQYLHIWRMVWGCRVHSLWFSHFAASCRSYLRCQKLWQKYFLTSPSQCFPSKVIFILF